MGVWREPGVWQWQSCSIRDGTGAGGCPPLGLASSWTLMPPAPVLARLWREGSWSLLVPVGPIPRQSHPHSPVQRLYAKLLFRASTTVSGWGNFSLRGGPFPMPLHSSTAEQKRGIRGSGVPGSPPPPPGLALTAAVLLDQGHLEAVPARRPGVDVHGEMGHGPAQGLAHRRRVAPEHASALAAGTRHSSATRGTPKDLPPPPATSAAHQCSITTRGPTSPGLPSSWAWA